MQLSSASDRLLESDQPLVGLDQLIWQTLAEACGTSEHPWNLGAFSTTHGADPCQPRTRTVVLRRVDRKSLAIDFHTDVRSDKIRQLASAEASNQVCWLFYDVSSRIQLRLEGDSQVIDGEEADGAWTRTSLDSRASYLSIRPPGERVSTNSPPDTSDRRVSWADSQRGRANFRVVRTFVRHVDWLYLRRQGHVRVAIDYDASGRSDACWVVP